MTQTAIGQLKQTYLRAQQKNRLTEGGRIDRDVPCVFMFNGKPLLGYAGDTLASALLANGVDVVGRSFKYARPRGLMTAGVEEPNGILQLGNPGAGSTPNIRATEQALYDGLICHSVNGWPSVDKDVMSLVGRVGGAAMGPGFYYKTFMFPTFGWKTYEKVIRKAAGLGRAPSEPDTDRYDHRHLHVDVMVIGAGPAGLAAALAASRQGARVCLADEQHEMGGALLFNGETIGARPAMQWVSATLDELRANPRVQLLSRATVNGYHDHHYLTIYQRLTDHLAPDKRGHGVRHRLHKVRAKSVVLASGAHERPLVFANNDRPGCFVASAISHYVNRYAVVPGQRLVVMTNNDSAYQCALDWLKAGRTVVAVVDTRQVADGTLTDQVRERGIRIITGSAIIDTAGNPRVASVQVASINATGTMVTGRREHVACDTVATSGGWSPVVHLSCHTGNRPIWDEVAQGFTPGDGLDNFWCAGSVTGQHALGECLGTGVEAGTTAARATVNATQQEDAASKAPLRDDLLPVVQRSDVGNELVAPAMPLHLVPHEKTSNRAPPQFVDMQNDVTAAAIQMAVREGFESIEHVKRYTAMGFGTDQGKTGNINGLAIVARELGQTIPATGTTVFRPNYTPISFGAVAGRHVNARFDPRRYTPMHDWHATRGATFEPVGQWMRAWYYPEGSETLQDAVQRECLAVRGGVGVLDASTLGKIDIQGKDAREFLGRVYTNRWAKLAPGQCRYGLMCGEDGMVLDDGVTACLADDHFLMTTTTGGAAHVLSWLEIYHQTEWPELDVFFTSVTDHWATISIAGPQSRALLATVTDDIALDAESFPFMAWRGGTVAGVPARVARISFTGELSYEINVPAHLAMSVWSALFEHGSACSPTPYGTETMHVLRAEKGFIIVGQDTDGSVTPMDINHGWCVANDKPFSFIGKRGMQRVDCLRTDRKQLVGLMTEDPHVVLPEGAQAVRTTDLRPPVPMVGHTTSSYYSANCGHSIALALITDGLARLGETLYFPMADGRVIKATTTDTVFFDPDGIRQRS